MSLSVTEVHLIRSKMLAYLLRSLDLVLSNLSSSLKFGVNPLFGMPGNVVRRVFDFSRARPSICKTSRTHGPAYTWQLRYTRLKGIVIRTHSYFEVKHNSCFTRSTVLLVPKALTVVSRWKGSALWCSGLVQIPLVNVFSESATECILGTARRLKVRDMYNRAGVSEKAPLLGKWIQLLDNIVSEVTNEKSLLAAINAKWQAVITITESFTIATFTAPTHKNRAKRAAAAKQVVTGLKQELKDKKKYSR